MSRCPGSAFFCTMSFFDYLQTNRDKIYTLLFCYMHCQLAYIHKIEKQNTYLFLYFRLCWSRSCWTPSCRPFSRYLLQLPHPVSRIQRTTRMTVGMAQTMKIPNTVLHRWGEVIKLCCYTVCSTVVYWFVENLLFGNFSWFSVQFQVRFNLFHCFCISRLLTLWHSICLQRNCSNNW